MDDGRRTGLRARRDRGHPAGPRLRHHGAPQPGGDLRRRPRLRGRRRARAGLRGHEPGQRAHPPLPGGRRSRPGPRGPRARWATERRWRWAIDTGTPEVTQRDPPLRREALMAEYQALAAAVPCDVDHRLPSGHRRADHVAGELDRLRHHQGLHSEGELGKAAGSWRWLVIAGSATSGNARTRAPEGDTARRPARQRTPRAGYRHPGRRWHGCSPARTVGWSRSSSEPRHKVASLSHKDGERSRWCEAHPEVPHRLEAIDTEVSGNE